LMCGRALSAHLHSPTRQMFPLREGFAKRAEVGQTTPQRCAGNETRPLNERVRSTSGSDQQAQLAHWRLRTTNAAPADSFGQANANFRNQMRGNPLGLRGNLLPPFRRNA
jgi:hypothetical protein